MMNKVGHGLPLVRSEVGPGLTLVWA